MFSNYERECDVTKYVPQNVKNIKFVAIGCVLSSSKMHQNTFYGRGSRPGLRWGSLRRSPDSLRCLDS